MTPDARRSSAVPARGCGAPGACEWRRPLSRGAALALIGCSLAALLTACGSGSDPSVAVTSACRRVSAVLANGKDGVSDPAGPAEAQLLPLARIRTSDRSLRAAIGSLASAYERFFASRGSSAAAAAAVITATVRMNRLCPGAAA